MLTGLQHSDLKEHTKLERQNMKMKRANKAHSRARRKARIAKLEEDSYVHLKEVREQYSFQDIEHNSIIRHAPAIFVMLGPGFENYGTEDLLHELITLIRYHTRTNPGMITRGRTADLFRINYRHRNDKIFGFKSRAKPLLFPTIDYARLNALLSPLIVSNPNTFGLKTNKALNQLMQAPGAHNLDASSFRFHWSYFTGLLGSVRPVTWDKRQSIVAKILDIVRQHCGRVCPDSNLLRDPRDCGEVLMEDETEVQRIFAWSLHGAEMGLAVQLEECFSRSDRTSEEYEDLIERLLYCFKRANRAEIYGDTAFSGVISRHVVGGGNDPVEIDDGEMENDSRKSGCDESDHEVEILDRRANGMESQVQENEKQEGEKSCLIM